MGRTSNLFIISDTHFGHQNIVKFTSQDGELVRKFDSVEHMNEVMITNWNSVVQPKDKVIHLGDFCFGPRLNLGIAARLNGKKTLILGNHDHSKASELLLYFDDLRGSIDLSGFILSHIPVHESQFTRFKGNIHGHVHLRSLPMPWYNACVEVRNYTPVAWEDVRKAFK